MLDQSVAASGEDSAYSPSQAAYLLPLLAGDHVGTVLDFGCGVGLLSGVCSSVFREPGRWLHVSRDSIARVPRTCGAGDVHLRPVHSPERHLIVAANVFDHIRPAERQAIVRELAGGWHREARWSSSSTTRPIL